MAALITITKGAVLPDSANKADFYNLVDLATATISGITGSELASNAGIVDTQLATISTAGKVSGTAITSGDIAITSSSTTTIPLNITASSLTTGTLAYLYSNSASNGSRTLVSIVNDNTAATGTTPLNIYQDAAAPAMGITQTANSYSLLITSSATTAQSFAVTSDTLTTGGLGYFYSNSADTGVRNLVLISNDNAAADSAIGLKIQQDGDAPGLYIDYNATVSDSITGLRIDGCTVANGTANVTISNVAPTAVGTATISKWLAVYLDDGVYYIPLWT